MTKKHNNENGDAEVLSNGKKHYSHEDISTNDKVGRKESGKSLLNLFRGRKKTIQNVEVDVLSSSGNSICEDDGPEKETIVSKESKKSSVLSLFTNKKNTAVECKP